MYSSIAFIACDKNDDDQNKTDSIIPVKMGNKWTYSTYYIHDQTDVSATYEIGDLVNINGINSYKYITAESSSNIVSLIKNDTGGNYVIVGAYSDVDTLITPSITYKLNAKKGDSWEYNDIIINEDYEFESRTLTMLCTNIDTLITTPKGSFKCMAFKHTPNSGEDVFREFISKNTGIIKIEHYEEGNLFSYTELTNYILK
ncbi:MAG: hypothetical protein AB7S48_03350 [Bacteroidales bacterium]